MGCTLLESRLSSLLMNCQINVIMSRWRPFQGIFYCKIALNFILHDADLEGVKIIFLYFYCRNMLCCDGTMVLKSCIVFHFKTVIQFICLICNSITINHLPLFVTRGPRLTALGRINCTEWWIIRWTNCNREKKHFYYVLKHVKVTIDISNIKKTK